MAGYPGPRWGGPPRLADATAAAPSRRVLLPLGGPLATLQAVAQACFRQGGPLPAPRAVHAAAPLLLASRLPPWLRPLLAPLPLLRALVWPPLPRSVAGALLLLSVLLLAWLLLLPLLLLPLPPLLLRRRRLLLLLLLVLVLLL